MRGADDWERDFLNNISLNPEMSFKALSEKYLNDLDERIKLNTYKTKETYLSAHLLPYFGDMTIGNITPLVIREWQNQILKAKSPRTKKEYSQTYLKSLNTLLSAIFNYAVRFHGLKENPCLKAGSIGKTTSDNEIQIWTLEEFNKFIDTVDRPDLHLGFNMLYWSGMRIGELLALNWNDINYSTNTIKVTKSYQRIEQEDVITEPKTTKSKRDIIMIKSVIDKIKDFKKQVYKPEGKDRIFPYQRRVFEKAIKRYSATAELNEIRIHDLRHSHASLLINNGINVVAISNRLGHEKVDTTLNIYSHLFPNSDNTLINKLENLERNLK
ncbi:tyrosine-type recombinase/integrase [Anaerosphaera multitolerans]|uniref:Site-specific integrase n=1 Tax=Anaerosphaera multitolerans TaxID=2487351 RepID=A0A437S6S0_9FIRM|nr:site-specific integrase [Anaerosphaera multitolerans]RVU54648.1 site-specific integrase [Anaerosphaera multitolerans]